MTSEINTAPLGKKRRIDRTLICMVLLIIVGFVFMHDLLGESLFSVPAWDSYTLQAMAWRDGRAHLDKNYTHLELAIYKDNYFVSFPPFPSVVMFPLTFIFGGDVPTNFIMMLYAVGLSIITYLMLRKLKINETRAAFLSVFYVFGSNLASIAMNGSVWWHAQMLCVLLCTAALYCALCNKRVAAYMLVAFSVGCRPFTILFFVLLFAMFYRDDKQKNPEKSFFALITKQLHCLIIPALVGAAYMFYNYIRFDNPLEFGHNYLPEFTSSEYGQFSLHYLFGNLGNLFLRPVTLTDKLGLEFTDFDGFMFYIANPIFLIVIVRVIVDLWKNRFDWMRGLTVSMILLYIVLLCCHKTLGGWQFGARYTVDAIPMALLYLILGVMPKKPAAKDASPLPAPEQAESPALYAAWKPTVFERAVCVFGIMFNIYGALYFWINFLYM